jgi:hypothetical protein
MRRGRLVVTALVLLGLAVAAIDESFFHSDDGSVLETHCHACLLLLGTVGVVTVPFSLPPVRTAVARVVPGVVPSHEDAPARRPSSRGPPSA